MGRKRTGTGKHISFFRACCVVSFLGICGCASLLGTSQHQGGPGTTKSLSGKGEERLSRARVLYDHGEYQAALEEAEAVLKTHFRSAGDDALFLTGLIYGHPNNPDKDWQEALKRFQRLKQAFPLSSMNERAELYALLVAHIAEQDRAIGDLGEKKAQLLKTVEAEKEKGKELEQEAERLRAETATLRDQLEKLKQIDLVIEEKKNQAK
jgi:tetratricopeptide (TPR) repeat protein